MNYLIHLKLKMILINVFIAIIIIAMIHYIYIYLQKNLTSPQVKDLIHRPEQEYKEIVSLLNTKNSTYIWFFYYSMLSAIIASVSGILINNQSIMYFILMKTYT